MHVTLILYNCECIFAGKPIFSVDIHPDGTKFATGGQGNGMSDQLVKNSTLQINI